MSDFQISIPGGESKRLLTGGKYCPADIVVTAEGGAAPVSVSPKEVNFYDYDGTCLYAYTVEEAQALTELPPLPEREGLICQGWNWTLEDVRSCECPLDVGAMYCVDGVTRLHIAIPNDVQKEVTLFLNQEAAGDHCIDWGDSGYDEPDFTGTGSIMHTYAAAGNYVISIGSLVDPSVPLGLGWGDGTNGLFGAYADNSLQPLRSILTKVEIGSHIKIISASAFYNCFNLETVTLHNGITSIGNEAFRACNSLRAVVLPDGLTSTGTYLFAACVSLKVVSIPASLDTLQSGFFSGCSAIKRVTMTDFVDGAGTYIFNACIALMEARIPRSSMNYIHQRFYTGCSSLSKIVVPDTIKTINAYAFYNCYGLQLLKFLPDEPPTVANANAFNNFPANAVVEVPASALETYQAATNYGAIAAQMVGV